MVSPNGNPMYHEPFDQPPRPLKTLPRFGFHSPEVFHLQMQRRGLQGAQFACGCSVFSIHGLGSAKLVRWPVIQGKRVCVCATCMCVCVCVCARIVVYVKSWSGVSMFGGRARLVLRVTSPFRDLSSFGGTLCKCLNGGSHQRTCLVPRISCTICHRPASQQWHSKGGGRNVAALSWAGGEGAEGEGAQISPYKALSKASFRAYLGSHSPSSLPAPMTVHS